MGVEELVDTQFAIPIAGVIICALLVFAFGFKSTVQPPSFDYLLDQKRTGGKASKKKNKEKVKFRLILLNFTVYQLLFLLCTIKSITIHFLVHIVRPHKKKSLVYQYHPRPHKKNEVAMHT